MVTSCKHVTSCRFGALLGTCGVCVLSADAQLNLRHAHASESFKLEMTSWQNIMHADVNVAIDVELDVKLDVKLDVELASGAPRCSRPGGMHCVQASLIC